MSDYQLGDEVLAPWASDGYLYPAVLVHIEGAAAHVAYLDGDEADQAAATIRQGILGPGLQVNVNWKGRRTYYDGVIRQRIGCALFVDYADGTQGWTTIGQCRVAEAVVGAIQANLMACPYCGNPMESTLPRCPTCGAPRTGRS